MRQKTKTKKLHTLNVSTGTFKELQKIKNITGQKYDNIIADGLAILSARRLAEKNRRSE